MKETEARAIIMAATQKASKEYRTNNIPNWKVLYRNDTKLNEYLDNENKYINSILMSTIPSDIRKLAI